MIIEARQAELEAFHAEVWAPPKPEAKAPTPKPTAPANLNDADLLKQAAADPNYGTEFAALYRGDASSCGGDESQRDFNLCRQLRYWTGADSPRMDRLFRSSGAMRPKWDEKRGETTYGAGTLQKAIDKGGKVYTPPVAPSQNGQEPEEAPPAADVQPAAAPPPAPPAEPPLPWINAVDGALPRVAQDAWNAILAANDPPTLFRFGGSPAWIESDDDGRPSPRLLGLDQLRHKVARVAHWYRPGKSQDGGQFLHPARPPLDVVKDLQATPNKPLPVLLGVTEAPVFARDGTLQTEPGYHPKTQLFHAPTPGLQIPPVADLPTETAVTEAKRLILEELLGDFPFSGPGQGASERAHAVCLLLERFARNLIHGPTPLYLVEKPTPGSGGTTLVGAVTLPAIGRELSAMTEGGDEDEWRKRLTARLRTGTPVIFIDNLRRTLDSGNLAAALTATVWEDRILGLSETAKIPVRCSWVASGNNPRLSNEIARRVVRTRLDAKHERPWQRTDFKHPNLEAWAHENRGRLIWAALTLIRHWLASGSPVAPDTPVLGKYEAWSRVMGGILHAAGIPGFLGNVEELYDRADAEGAAWRLFVAAWWEKFQGDEVGVGRLWALAVHEPEQPELPGGATLGFGDDRTRREEPMLDLGRGNDQSQKTRLGQLLNQMRDRQFGDRRILRGRCLKNAWQWQLAVVEPGDPPGDPQAQNAGGSPAGDPPGDPQSEGSPAETPDFLHETPETAQNGDPGDPYSPTQRDGKNTLLDPLDGVQAHEHAHGEVVGKGSPGSPGSPETPPAADMRARRTVCSSCEGEMPAAALVGPGPDNWRVENTHHFEPTRWVEHRYTCPGCRQGEPEGATR